ncbi:MAG: KpsF/GutQ family sugar-phosphate isomerase [Chitinophagaceae bacterium]|jgi:arabinose-5-phosphate isomerase|uniref:KpsF/GutQ family sugar-phosphate isomerase n=1 Tax=unclassified Paraflavitalea TaxID=2798305 RepID=UPI003D339113|nr:KpsF/GutQ family sugar-phosphate isomerase [Chitinophagaceae bacterium]
MTDRSLIKSVAARTVKLEAQAIANLETFIDADFVKAVEAVYQMKGRLVVSGIGKSAVIGMKIVATLNSTGTPAVFMHAADAIHGDLGMIQNDDVVLIISKSGESPEIKVLVPLVKNFKNIVIGMVGNTESFLSKNSDIVLNTTVSQEACPNNLAPTSSTTAQLVMGDAMAVALMELKGFTSEDFAKFHPGGALGKKLYLHVADLYKNNEKPVVSPKDSIKTVILEISKKRLGVTAVLDEKGVLLGIITDGDVRRMLEHHSELGGIVAQDIMTKTPKTIESDVLAVVALDEMRKQDVNQLVVLEQGNYVGIIHLHDLIREGLI